MQVFAQLEVLHLAVAVQQLKHLQQQNNKQNNMSVTTFTCSRPG
jgi:hypothetical protein